MKEIILQTDTSDRHFHGISGANLAKYYKRKETITNSAEYAQRHQGECELDNVQYNIALVMNPQGTFRQLSIHSSNVE